MRKNLLRTVLLASLCLAGLQNTKAAKHTSSKTMTRIIHYSDTVKILRYISAMPVQSTDSGNYGLHLQLSKDSLTYIQTGIYFYADASDKYSSHEDAVQVNGGTPQVYLSSYTSDNVEVCINTMSDYAKGKRVRLYVDALNGGTYTLSLADIFGMDTAEYNIYLIDNSKQDSVDIIHTKNYPFTINWADTTSYGANRFVLAIEHKPVKPYMLFTFSGEKISTGVQVSWQAINAGDYIGYTLEKRNNNNGYDSLYSIQSNPKISVYQFVDKHPIIGSNVYRLEQNGITGAISYSDNIAISYITASPNGAWNVYPNPAKTTMTISMASSAISIPNYVADIYDLSGAHLIHQMVTGGKWTSDVSSYKNGLYIIEITDTSGNLIGHSKFMKSN